MNVFLDSGYGVILIFWGLVFELGGLVMFLLIYWGIRRDQAHRDRESELLPEQARQAVTPTTPELSHVA